MCHVSLVVKYILSPLNIALPNCVTPAYMWQFHTLVCRTSPRSINYCRESLHRKPIFQVFKQVWQKQAVQPHRLCWSASLFLHMRKVPLNVALPSCVTSRLCVTVSCFWHRVCSTSPKSINFCSESLHMSMMSMLRYVCCSFAREWLMKVNTSSVDTVICWNEVAHLWKIYSIQHLCTYNPITNILVCIILYSYFIANYERSLFKFSSALHKSSTFSQSFFFLISL